MLIFDYTMRVKLDDADFECPEEPHLALVTTEYIVPFFGELTIFADEAEFLSSDHEGIVSPLTFSQVLEIVKAKGEESFWIAVTGNLQMGPDDREGQAFESTDGQKVLAMPWFSVEAKKVVIEYEDPENVVSIGELMLKHARRRERHH